MSVVKLFDEKILLRALQAEVFLLIKGCKSIGPVRYLVECHDILKLTSDIQIQYPSPEPVCDEQALLHLKALVGYLQVNYLKEVPASTFDSFEKNVRKLLRAFGVPRREFLNVRSEGRQLAISTSSNMPSLYVVDVSDG